MSRKSPMTELPRHQRAVLQAIIILGGFVKHWELSDVSGYSEATVHAALHHLKWLGLVERRSGYLVATERGKIVIAILIGQQTRARAARLLEAAE